MRGAPDVFNGAVVRTVDLNADLGERDVFTDIDRAVTEVVTSVSIACGFHAGSPQVMHDVAEACLARGVTIGAHVSYRDRAHFGRRAVAVEPERLVADVEEQCATLADAVGPVGATVGYVKPHGALYNAMATDREVAAALARAVAGQPHRTLVAQAHTPVVAMATSVGVRVVREGFPDRGYLPDGRLAPRDVPGAVVADPDEAARRARALALDGGLLSVDGQWTAVDLDTLCVHGDTPDADRRARAVRAALEAAGVEVRAFVSDPPRPAAG